jgi:LmbE family N-acetylglucosaminyl deacetylase
MLNIKTFSKVLIVIAHPDDEWWGLGGTLLRLKQSEANIKIIIVSDGERGDNSGELRMKNSEDLITNEMGFKYESLQVNANSFPSRQTFIIQELDQIIQDFNPDTVFTHFRNDLHQDHRITYESVLPILRNFWNISFFQIETPFKMGFSPNFFVNISDVFEQKLKLYHRYYEHEIKHRNEFSVGYLTVHNKMRGFEFGVPYAEGFELRGGII